MEREGLVDPWEVRVEGFRTSFPAAVTDIAPPLIASNESAPSATKAQRGDHASTASGSAPSAAIRQRFPARRIERCSNWDDARAPSRPVRRRPRRVPQRRAWRRSNDDAGVSNRERGASMGLTPRRASKLAPWAAGITRSVASSTESFLSAIPSAARLLSSAGVTTRGDPGRRQPLVDFAIVPDHAARRRTRQLKPSRTRMVAAILIRLAASTL
jgi:hypothetical protein